MRRENAYILELCRFQDADPERLRDWMAQGLDYPYILGHLLFNRMGGSGVPHPSECRPPSLGQPGIPRRAGGGL